MRPEFRVVGANARLGAGDLSTDPVDNRVGKGLKHDAKF
jgi:hypothetical protein